MAYGLWQRLAQEFIHSRPVGIPGSVILQVYVSQGHPIHGHSGAGVRGADWDSANSRAIWAMACLLVTTVVWVDGWLGGCHES